MPSASLDSERGHLGPTIVPWQDPEAVILQQPRMWLLDRGAIPGAVTEHLRLAIAYLSVGALKDRADR